MGAKETIWKLTNENMVLEKTVSHLQYQHGTATARIAELEAQIANTVVTDNSAVIDSLTKKLARVDSLINDALNVLDMARKKHNYVINQPLSDRMAEEYFDGAVGMLNRAMQVISNEALRGEE